ncbi:hypothetical protein ACJX0J_014028, partial [Zea mays]
MPLGIQGLTVQNIVLKFCLHLLTMSTCKDNKNYYGTLFMLLWFTEKKGGQGWKQDAHGLPHIIKGVPGPLSLIIFHNVVQHIECITMLYWSHLENYYLVFFFSFVF